MYGALLKEKKFEKNYFFLNLRKGKNVCLLNLLGIPLELVDSVKTHKLNDRFF